MARRRGGLSAVSVVLLAPALALLGNIATNTVEVSWHWWPLTVWVLVALLVAGTVWVEVRRAAPEPDDGEPVVVTPQFVDVDYVREDRTGKLLPASGLLLRLGHWDPASMWEDGGTSYDEHLGMTVTPDPAWLDSIRYD